MTTKNNPFSSRWDKRSNPSKVSRKDAALIYSMDVIQTTLYYEGILIEMDPSLYLPALEKWCQKYPQYITALLKTAVQTNDTIVRKGEIPPFAAGFFLGIFQEIDRMVNGEVANNLNYLGNYW